MAVVPNMHLEPNVGSDRSWVWNAAADVSEGEPEAQTLAIRFANGESKNISVFEDMIKIPGLTDFRRQPVQRCLRQRTAGE